LQRFALFFLLPLQALASEPPTPGVSSGSYLQAALALALIVGLLMGAAWLARKISGGKVFGQGGMKVIGGVALGPRERLVLVEVGDTWLVIGLVPGQIRTLHQLPKGNEPDLSAANTDSAEAPFKQWLKSVSERNRNV
jgi:flagellar protein FliO/FliZ